MSTNEPPPRYSAGDAVKDGYNTALSTGMKSTWSKVREVGFGSFAKGVLFAGLLVVGVMALVGGFMGGNSSLSVGGALMNTFEKGAGAGISKAIQFLASGLGIGTLVAGGLFSTASDIIKTQQKNGAIESERLALEYQKAREHNQGLAKEHNHARTYNHEHHHHKHEAPREAHKEAPKPAPEQDNGIYVKGTMVKTEKFASAELVRRSQRETVMQVGGAA
ncbi:MAG: hypothetical protein K2Q01_09475 [Rickettsiales bacterium]|nr:hypothetical protein [Rickettsiales bacterium]